MSGRESAVADREDGPASQVLLASIAKRYYLDGQSKVRISKDLGLSRFQVARMLERAVSTGLVRIEIGSSGRLDLDRSGRLQDAFALQHAVVVDASEHDVTALRRQLAAAAAELLAEIVTPSDVLGVAWARAISAMAAHVPSLPPVPVVQLTGALSGRGIDESCVELVRGLARVAGGPAYYFYAPLTVPDARTARTLRSQPEVARTLARFDDVTKAITGIGRWSGGASTVYDAAAPADRRRMHDLGVCAELSGVFLDARGRLVRDGLGERTIAITPEQLRAVPEVIALPYGVDKAPAVRAALLSGLVTGLVTHAGMADALLERA